MRPTYLEVNLLQLKQNLENIRAHVAPAKVMAVLKANAYGHGVDGVAPYIAPYVDYIGVAIVEEGIHLRELGLDNPILVMGGTLPEQVPAFAQYDLTLAVSSFELLDAAEQVAQAAKKKLKIHLKIDTGMERTGVHEYEAEAFIEKSLMCRHLDIEGIFTHFANSELNDLNSCQTATGTFSRSFKYLRKTKRGASADSTYGKLRSDLANPRKLFRYGASGRDVLWNLSRVRC